jgi:ribosome-associated translation inhibitor RaiA
MHVEHYEKNVLYTDRDLLLLAKKLGKLATYCEKLKDESSIIRVEAESRQTKKERDQVKVMVTLTLPKKVLRAESRRPRVLDALDRCIEKLKPQVIEYKEMHAVRWKRPRRRAA